MRGLSLFDQNVLAAIGLAATAALVYLVVGARHRVHRFGLVDGLILVTIMSIVTATAIPFFNGASDRARTSALLQNLHTLRSQIALYKMEHGDTPPLLYEGTFPQLTSATNAEGIPGPPGKRYPYGPYLFERIPPNPYTGRSVVTPIDSFPPRAASGNGGWLYHQKTGRITADLKKYLGK